MKKVVLKVELYHDRIKQKAMKKASGISGVESVSVDTKDEKMTLTGDIDPVRVVEKLRKMCHTEIVSVGPAKEEKKNTPKKDDKKKVEDDKKPDPKVIVPCEPYWYTCYYSRPQYYWVEECPSGCVIC